MFEIYPKSKGTENSIVFDIDSNEELNDSEARRLCYSHKQCAGYRSYWNGNVKKWEFYQTIPSTEYTTDDSVLYIKKSNNNLLFVMLTLFVVLCVVVYWFAKN